MGKYPLGVLLVTLSFFTDGIAGRQDTPVRLGTDVVTVNIAVTDAFGRCVVGLQKENFNVFENKIRQNIEFFSDEDAPVSIGIIFDVSGSMRMRLDRAKDALARCLEASNEQDDFFLVGFNQQPRELSGFTRNANQLVNSLIGAHAGGSTALYDAVYIGVEKVRQGSHTRRALIVISDGQDNNSRYSYEELRELLREAGVQVYCVGIVSSGDPLISQGEWILEEISRLTGGRSFFTYDSSIVGDVMAQIALELRHQYSIGYASTNTVRDGRWRKIRVEVHPPPGLPRLFINAREGYYAK